MRGLLQRLQIFLGFKVFGFQSLFPTQISAKRHTQRIPLIYTANLSWNVTPLDSSDIRIEEITTVTLENPGKETLICTATHT
jgi:hypothetical protein